MLRRERWAIVLDGTEVAQYDSGSWLGRFLHPELGRLLEELASEPLPGVVGADDALSAADADKPPSRAFDLA